MTRVTTEKTYLPERLQRELIHRLRRLQGHVGAIAEMIERQESCDDVLVQISAVRSGLNRATVRLLEGHLDSCVKGCLAEGDEEEIEAFKHALAMFFKRL